MIGVMKMSETSESRKKNKLRTILIWTVIALMLITGIACFALTYALLGIKRPSVDLSDYDLHANANLPYVDDIVNIAVFGLDSRTHENSGRSDLIMVLTFDSIHGKIKATSIMRDSLVDIKGVGNVKINSAYAYGGAKLAINTINRNFGLNITDYISVNFSQMAEIVDAVGGIEVEISEAERQNANKYIKEMAKEEGFEPDLIEESGAVKLRGYQAVIIRAYARSETPISTHGASTRGYAKNIQEDTRCKSRTISGSFGKSTAFGRNLAFEQRDYVYRDKNADCRQAGI